MKTMKRVLWLMGALALLAGACGGSSAKTCQDACNKIYDQCQLALKDQNNNDLPKGTCVSACNALTTNRQQVIDCIMARPCVADQLYACVP
jgi:hypothetical protein